MAVSFSKVGIYSSALALLATSADDNTAFQSTGWKQVALTATYTVPNSGLYYLASGFAATTTQPDLLFTTQNATVSDGYPAGTFARAVYAQVPVAGQGLPNPAVSQGTFTSVPCLVAY